MRHAFEYATRFAMLSAAADGKRDSGGSAIAAGQSAAGKRAADDLLAAAIAERLAAAEDAEVDRVHVAVQRARVTLRGEVPSRRSMGRIEALIASCDGVSHIDNQMRIGYSH